MKCHTNLKRASLADMEISNVSFSIKGAARDGGGVRKVGGGDKRELLSVS